MTPSAINDALQSARRHHQSGQLSDAEKIYRQILSHHPNHPETLHLLGALSAQLGQLNTAENLLRQAIHFKPDYAEAHNNLGSVLAAGGRTNDAIASFERAIALKPDLADAHHNLATALVSVGRLDQAIAPFRQLVLLKPNLPDAHNHLGIALFRTGQLNEAISSFRTAIQLQPDHADAHYNLGTAYFETRQLDAAIASYKQTILLSPNHAKAHSNLGIALQTIGQIDQAIASFRQAIKLSPDLAEAHSNLLFALQLHPVYDAVMIQNERKYWNEKHAVPLKKFIQPLKINRDPTRRLRIGYLSPDFRNHVVGQNLLPLLRHHDHQQFEIFCYTSTTRPDALTDQIRSHTDAWRLIAQMSDSQAADLIRHDQIDILVDLSLHSAGNRLLIFAQKPAPIQVTYLGYCSSTGLATMDFRLSDPHLDPPNSDLSRYTEQTIRLPETYWCYAPGGPTPDPSPPPASNAGFITFGCLNNFAKVPPTFDLWAQILQIVPHSRLIIHSHPGKHLDDARKHFADKGISPNRLEFPPHQPWPQYIRTYNRIDIALDPFPWSGGITTCDALWMGVPVITLAGQTALARGGASILQNLSLPDLIAHSPEHYIQIATTLAADPTRLTNLRHTLRPRMQTSPLMDPPRFARNIEAAYRQMRRMLDPRLSDI